MLLILFICIGASLAKYEIVKTDSGPLRGKSLKTLFDYKEYFSFKGIPYAEVPINNLRFKVGLFVFILTAFIIISTVARQFNNFFD